MKRRFAAFVSDRRISRVLPVGMAVVIIFSLAAFTLLEVRDQRERFYGDLEEKGLLLIRTVNDALGDALYFRDVEKLRHLAEVVKAQPEISHFTVFDPEGRVLVGSGDEKYPVGTEADAQVLDLMKTGVTSVSRGEQTIEVSGPIVVGRRVIGGVHFGLDTRPLQTEIRSMVMANTWQGLLITVVAVIVTSLLTRSLIAPIDRLVAATRRIAAGDLQFSARNPRRDEVGELARAFEEMTRRLREAGAHAEEQTSRLAASNRQLREEIGKRNQAQEAAEESNIQLSKALEELRQAQQHIIQQERLRALGQMASGIAHDINNTLQAILGISQRLMMSPEMMASPEKVEHTLGLIGEAAGDATKVVGRLSDFYRLREKGGELESISLNEIVERAVALTEPRWQDQARARGVDIRVVTNLEEVPSFEGNASELREGLINLLINAIDAMPSGGTVLVTTACEQDCAVLTVTDTGFGMTEEVRQRCLEPFFSTKGEKGSGLGLAAVYGTAQRHGGSLQINSSPGAGTTITVSLPIRKPQGMVPEGSVRSQVQGALRVLLVDDEDLVRVAVAGLLEGDGHQVVSVIAGEQALQRLAVQDFDLVITDMAMPGMSGEELAMSIKQSSPQLPVVMLTGFGDMMLATDEQPRGTDVVVGKPVTVEALRQVIAEAVGSNHS